MIFSRRSPTLDTSTPYRGTFQRKESFGAEFSGLPSYFLATTETGKTLGCAEKNAWRGQSHA